MMHSPPPRKLMVRNSLNFPQDAIPADKHYQWASHSVVGERSLGNLEAMKKNGWTPVPWARHADLPYDPHPSGHIVTGGLILVEKPRDMVDESRRDDLIMNLLAAAAARAALASEVALFNGNSVKEAFDSIRDAYGDKAFRERHRDTIRARARNMAIDAGVAPDPTIMLEKPLNRYIEEVGISVWYCSADRLMEAWRVFEPAAVAALKKEGLR